MKGKRAQEAYEKAVKEGRIISDTGVKKDAMVPGFPPQGVKEEFARQVFHVRADACTSEKQWQAAVIELAKFFGWRVAHCRKVLVKMGDETHYETPMVEDGKGWPDLFMVRGKVALAVELKFGLNTTSPEQDQWLSVLDYAGIQGFVWYPTQWEEVWTVLKHSEST